MEVAKNKDRFLSGLQKKYNKGNADKESLKAKKQTITGIIGDITKVPEKLSVIGPVGKTSVRPSKVDENKLSGLDGKLLIEGGN